MILFRAKTNEGYYLKVLVELLQNNVKTACFTISKDGIFFRMMDQNRTILMDLALESNSFTLFKYNNPNKMEIGINLTHLLKMLKPVKKRDSLELYIEKDSETDLGIKILPKESNRITTSFIKIQTIQSIDIEIPKDYSKAIIVSSSEFQKLCKGLSNISNITNIESVGSLIRFSNNADSVMGRITEFGERDDDDSEEEVNTYNEDFDTEQLVKITKISGLNNSMQVFTKKDKPLLIRSLIGSLGWICIYLKSRKEQEIESNYVEE